MKSHVVPLHPTRDLSHPFVRHLHLVIWYLSWLSDQLLRGRRACVQVTPFDLIMTPKHESSDAGDSGMLKRSPEVLPLREKAQILNLVRNEKKLCAEAHMVKTNLLYVKL